MVDLFQSLEEQYGHIVTRCIELLYKYLTQPYLRYSLGVSVEGRQLEALKLTSPEGKLERPLLRPMVRVMGNIHGDGSVSREMVIALARYLDRTPPIFLQPLIS